MGQDHVAGCVVLAGEVVAPFHQCPVQTLADGVAFAGFCSFLLLLAGGPEIEFGMVTGFQIGQGRKLFLADGKTR